MPSELERILAEIRAKTRYFLAPNTETPVWQEVTEEDFVRAEQGAGFLPKPGCGPVATGGFSAGGQQGTSISLEKHLTQLGRYIDLEGNLHDPTEAPHERSG